MNMFLLITVLLLLGLIIFYSYRQGMPGRAKKKIWLKLSRTFDQMVLQHKLSIEYSEVLGSRVIALDRLNKKMLVVDHNETSRQEICISLSGIKAIEVKEEKREDGCIQKIFLELHHRSSEKVFTVTFFDATQDQIKHLPSRHRKASYWKNRLESQRNPSPIAFEQNLVPG